MLQPRSLSRQSVQASTKPVKPRIPLFVAVFLERWKRVARKIGDFQARLLLTIFYLFIVGPFALLIRWRGDPLRIRPRTPQGWLPYAARKGTPMERATEQF
jgi:hypothetical protein